ncbi:MAG: GtrA family protein [Pseudomonadota bacterium]|nr:GtrA family protein [Pseudomonadota bacterium]
MNERAVRRIAGQFGLFIAFGAVQLGVDWLTFVLLTWSGADVAPANIAGRVIGAALGYYLNSRYTFPQEQGVPRAEHGTMMRFLLAWAATSLVSTLILVAVEQQFGLQAAWVGKLLVDGIIAVLAFLLSKYWIFK